MGRLVGLLGIALVAGIVGQAVVGSELRELEALGEGAPAADLARARWLFWASAATAFGAALGLGCAVGSLSGRTIRSASFPPPDAAWLGARRHYEGAAARRVGWLGMLLSAFLAAAGLGGLAITVFLAVGSLG